MNVKLLQTLLNHHGFPVGTVDGDAGRKTHAGAKAALAAAGVGAAGWSDARRLVGALQHVLNMSGHAAGAVDGLMGHNTENAIEEAEASLAGVKLVVNRTPLPAQPAVKGEIPTQAECPSFYGNPAKGEVKPHIISFDLPMKLRLDWDLGTTVSRVSLHRKAGPSFVAAIGDVRDKYGEDVMRRLGIDRYAGGYNHRSMRGGSAWSMHAYGCAVDFYAAPNGLKARCPQALFCKPEYQPFLDIMEAHGWLPAIRLWGADAMHFQRARLR